MPFACKFSFFATIPFNLDATVIFRYNKLLFKAELQGRKVPNIAYLPNVTLSVRFGHNIMITVLVTLSVPSAIFN